MIVFTATEAKNKLGEVLEQVEKEAVQITKNNKPYAYVLSAREYRIARPAIALDRVRRAIRAGDEEILGALRSFAEGRHSRQSTVHWLGLDNYGDLLYALSAAGLEPPRIPSDQAKRMALDFDAAIRHRAARLVLADWGALVSLAHAGELDLLTSFHPDIRIHTTDVVMHNVTERLDAVNSDAIGAFFGRNRARVQIDATSFARVIKAAESDPELQLQLPWDMAELSIYSYMRSLPPANHGEATIALLQDEWFLTCEIRLSSEVGWIATSTFRDRVAATTPATGARHKTRPLSRKHAAKG